MGDSSIEDIVISDEKDITIPIKKIRKGYTVRINNLYEKIQNLYKSKKTHKELKIIIDHPHSIDLPHAKDLIYTQLDKDIKQRNLDISTSKTIGGIGGFLASLTFSLPYAYYATNHYLLTDPSAFSKSELIAGSLTTAAMILMSSIVGAYLGKDFLYNKHKNSPNPKYIKNLLQKLEKNNQVVNLAK